jgi:hypothetical protein
VDIRKNLDDVQRRVLDACARAGRDPGEVKLVAVTKNVDVDRIREAMACGIRRFGENYVQEALPKIRALGPGAEWHFIGHLQTNKAKYAVGQFHMIHTVDRLSLAQELDRRSAQAAPLPILIQVNVSGEETKSGTPPEALADLLSGLVRFPHLRIRGLMSMAPFFDDPEVARPTFRALREWRDRLRDMVSFPHSMDELSMGMTGDFEAAIEEGATFVRIGTALFGPRQPWR